MAEFAYNNVKNVSISHILFKLNCGYYSRVLFEEDIESRSRSCSANKLTKELRKLIKICYKNLFYLQELQKTTHNKKVKSGNYALSKKV